jgi:hypothetical protein
LRFIVLFAAPAGVLAQPTLLSGTIGKAPVMLSLNDDNGRLSGWYVYLRVGKQIKLAGTRKADGAFALEEFAVDDPKQRKRTGYFAGAVAQGRWTGTWHKPEGGADVNVDLSENHATLANSNIDLKCAATRTDRRSGDTAKYTLALTLANGAMSRFSMAQHITARSGVDNACMMDLGDLKPLRSDVGLLLGTSDLAEDGTPRCTIRLIEAGDYLFVQIGDVTAKDNDCRGGEEIAYCSPRQYWADLIVDRKSSACQPVE